MQNETAHLLAVIDDEVAAVVGGEASVSNLATGLSVEVRLVEDHEDVASVSLGVRHEGSAVKDSLHCHGKAGAFTAGRRPLVLGLVVSRLNAVFSAQHGQLLGSQVLNELVVSIALTALVVLLHGSLEAGNVERETLLLAHDLSEIDRETVGGQELEGDPAFENLASLEALGSLVEKSSASVESAAKLFLLVSNDCLDLLLVSSHLREGVAQDVDHSVDHLVEPGLVGGPTEDLTAVTDGSAENATENVASALVGWDSAISQGGSESSSVVSHGTVSEVNAVGVLAANLALVLTGRVGAQLAESGEERHKEVGVVVGAQVVETGDKTLETHTGINAALRQRRELTAGLTVELHEDKIPNLENIGVVHVHELGAVTIANSIVVNLRARAAGTSVAHLPEVILDTAGNNVVLRQALEPQSLGFLISGNAALLIAAEVRGIESARIEAVDLGEKVESEVNCLRLEVVAERPVAKHLEESVVVHVLADILQVVVLAACTNALLTVACTSQAPEFGVFVRVAQEYCLVLAHSGVHE